MKKQRIFFISIKWKISLALISISSVIIFLFILMATSTFESDKISYLFDFFQLKVNSQASQIGDRLSRVLFNAKSVLTSVQVGSRQLTPMGVELFNSMEDIKGLRVYSSLSHDPILQITKENYALPAQDDKRAFESTPSLEMISQKDESNYRIAFQLSTTKSIKVLIKLNVEIFISISDFLSDRAGQGIIFLTLKNKILARQGPTTYSDHLINSVVETSLQQRNKSGQSSLIKVGNREYLLSYAQVPFKDLTVFYLEDKESAFQALNILAKRSTVFALFAFFILGIVSLFTSSNLTRHIQSLTIAAKNIGKGNLETQFEIKSNDEIGVLAKTFAAMATDIKRLILETKDKERMAHELKTAQFVQSHLFPHEFSHSYGNVKVAGKHLTSTECGGDWWYYFSYGENVFVAIADATGHGTPAAMITAVSRSIFVRFEESPTHLEDMVADWSKAIACCSGQRIFMTATLIQINMKTGQYKIINASHEHPIKIAKKECRALVLPISPILGDVIALKKKPLHVYQGQLENGDRLLLYTDGIWDIKTKTDAKLSERRFYKTIEEINYKSKEINKFMGQLFGYIESTQGENDFTDDIAAVVIEYSEENS